MRSLSHLCCAALRAVIWVALPPPMRPLFFAILKHELSGQILNMVNHCLTSKGRVHGPAGLGLRRQLIERGVLVPGSFWEVGTVHQIYELCGVQRKT
jgi:hypothetical protein